MKTPQLLQLRLQNQSIAGTLFEKPADAVARMGAVQAQDYPGALWAVGLRTHNAAEKDIEQAIRERTIIRTWTLRGTLHIVAAADIRWLLDLLGPRLLAGARGRHQQLGLDDTIFKTARDILVHALQGGRQLRIGHFQAADAQRGARNVRRPRPEHPQAPTTVPA